MMPRSIVGPSLPLAGSLLLLLALAGAACGQTEAGEARWEPVPLPLGGGHTYATYDAQRDVIWLLNWSFVNASGRFNDSAATLMRFEPESQQQQSYTLEGPTDGLGADAGLAVDRQGAVWAAWGHRLIRLDPAGGDTQEWTLPQPDTTDLAGYDPTLEGMAVEVAPAPDGRVWVAPLYATAVLVLDPATASWSQVDTAPLMVIERSRLSFAEDGRLLLNGVIKGHPDLDTVFGAGSAMVSIDPDSGKATLTDIAVFAYGPRADGAVDYIDGTTGEAQTLTAGGAERSTGARFEVDTLHPIRQVMTGDGQGGVWVWQARELALDIVRLDADTGETSLYPYPLTISTWDGSGPLPNLPPNVSPSDFIGKPRAASPEIHGLLVDNRGDVWAVSASSEYPVLYRLHVE